MIMKVSASDNFEGPFSFQEFSAVPIVNELELWPQIGNCWTLGINVRTDSVVPTGSRSREHSHRNSSLSRKEEDGLSEQCQSCESLEVETIDMPIFLAPPLKPEYQFIQHRPEKKSTDQEVPSFPEKKLMMKEVSSTILVCSHCQTEATSLWRRIMDKLMCNACALYYKLHGVMRPLHLNTGIIKRRNRLGSSAKRHRRYKC